MGIRTQLQRQHLAPQAWMDKHKSHWGASPSPSESHTPFSGTELAKGLSSTQLSSIDLNKIGGNHSGEVT